MKYQSNEVAKEQGKSKCKSSVSWRWRNAMQKNAETIWEKHMRTTHSQLPGCSVAWVSFLPPRSQGFFKGPDKWIYALVPGPQVPGTFLGTFPRDMSPVVQYMSLGTCSIVPVDLYMSLQQVLLNFLCLLRLDLKRWKKPKTQQNTLFYLKEKFYNETTVPAGWGPGWWG